MRKIAGLLIALIIYFAISIVNEQLLIKHLILPLFPPGYIKEHFWIRQHIHHLGQMFLAIIVIVFVLRGRLKDYGLNLQNRSLSKRYILWFFLVYGVITVLNFLPNFLAGRPEPAGFSLTAFNIFGWFSFAALMSGTSEEIFFRGLLQTFLYRTWKDSIAIMKINVPTAGIMAALIYAFAHVEINFSPFTMNYNILQVIAAVVLGIFFGMAYDRTKSLLAPIVTHNYANFIMYFVGYLTVIFFS